MWIRSAGERDLTQIQSLLVETWHDTYDGLYGVEKVDAITADWHAVPKLKERLNRPQSEFVVADNGEAILGVAFASTKDGRAVHLHQLYVRPAAQGQGVGAALLAEIEDCFPEARLFRLEVEPENGKAVGFYQRSGFKEVGKTENCGTADSGVPALIFEKAIR